MSDIVGGVPKHTEDLATAIVRPYVMTPEEWREAFLRSSARTGLLRRLLTGLKELPHD